MEPLNILMGKALLPGIDSIAQLLIDGGEIRTDSEYYLTPSHKINAATLGESDLKSLNLNRAVRRISEKQSRWVMDVAINTWRQHQPNATEDRTGLFLGLGIVDCMDDEKLLEFDGSPADYAHQALTQSEPLAALTMLNSTVGSHIAQVLNITGANAIFSPGVDAGGQAVIEAAYNLAEDRCDYALVAAGSQKITPWYFSTYRAMVSQLQNQNIFLSESAAALIMTRESIESDGKLLAVKRGYSRKKFATIPELDTLLTEMAAHGVPFPREIILTSAGNSDSNLRNSLKFFLPDSNLFVLEHLTGYSGPSGAINACGLALEILKQKRTISEKSNRRESHPTDTKTVLVVVNGFHGQICMLLLGGTDEIS